MDTDGSRRLSACVTLYRPHSGDSRLLHLTNVRPLTIIIIIIFVLAVTVYQQHLSKLSHFGGVKTYEHVILYFIQVS